MRTSRNSRAAGRGGGLMETARESIRTRAQIRMEDKMANEEE